MAISKLDHYSIRTKDLEATRRFYNDVMGFGEGARPQFPFPGSWHYNNGVAVVHVVGIDPNDPAGLLAYLGDRPMSDDVGTGTLDHVAFVASDVEAMRQHFAAKGIATRERSIPNMNLHQIFLDDPNGVVIELNFPT